MDLMFSLFRSRDNPNITVTFETSVGRMLILVDSIEREDGSGDSWLFKGYIYNAINDTLSDRVEGYFSTKERRGSFKTVSRFTVLTS
ncbi:MAG: hypothetical protein WAX66_01855 [Patescibacteria group bacterium]